MANDQDLYLEASKSTALSAAFSTLAQTDVAGVPKFTPSLCREVGKLIVCRTYSSAVLELSHLIVAATDLSGDQQRYEYFFWDSGIAHPDVFRRYCKTQAETEILYRLVVGNQGVTLDYQDGPFTITYIRMPVLSALLEFLLTALGYITLDDALAPLRHGLQSRQSVSKVANTLSRLIYDYLRDHLPTAQSQRKFRTLLDYCDQDSQAIDDEMILSFWKDYDPMTDTGIDFKTYDSVVDSFLRLLQSLDGAKDLLALQKTSSIGKDFDQEEANPDHIHQQLDYIEEEENPLRILQTAPVDQVKFLTQRETSHTERTAKAGSFALRIPLSILRSDTFRLMQSRLTQAVRQKRTPAAFHDIIVDTSITYLSQRETYQNVRENSHKILLASLHALLLAQSPQAITILLALDPDGDYEALRPLLIAQDDRVETSIVTLASHPIEGHLMKLIQQASQGNGPLQTLLDQAATVYNSLTRKGFKEDIRHTPELITAFEQGSVALLQLYHRLERYTQKLDDSPHDWAEQFQIDHPLFQKQFTKLYAIGGPQ